ncbi:MAG: MgtC/SapB family protein [Lachnospiraceae bacterium]|nr:MgtC/SapB family protein [Lachnospiraceae bacterium]MBQ4304297.1 MgtC/SapB family protein [Lachnospiraceae bacterium]
MLPVFDGLRELTIATVILRVILATMCGALVGIERSYNNRAAGFRTHMLVCIAASIAAMTGIYLYIYEGVPTDPTRLPAQIISGLGFIGGGTIFVTSKKNVVGLTTAAGLWASGIVGLCIGGGFYEGGILAAFMIICAETRFFGLIPKVSHLADFTIAVNYTHTEALDRTMRFLKDHRMRIRNLQIEGEGDGEAYVYTAVLTIRPYEKMDEEVMKDSIEKLDGIISISRV